MDQEKLYLYIACRYRQFPSE